MVVCLMELSYDSKWLGHFDPSQKAEKRNGWDSIKASAELRAEVGMRIEMGMEMGRESARARGREREGGEEVEEHNTVDIYGSQTKEN